MILPSTLLAPPMLRALCQAVEKKMGWTVPVPKVCHSTQLGQVGEVEGEHRQGIR